MYNVELCWSGICQTSLNKKIKAGPIFMGLSQVALRPAQAELANAFSRRAPADRRAKK